MWPLKLLYPDAELAYFGGWLGSDVNLDWLGLLIGGTTKWSMFSPRPPPSSGWFHMPGVLNDGTEVNLFALGGPVFRDVIMNLPPYRRNVPADMSLRLSANYCFKQFPAERWRKFMVRISCFVFFHS